MGMVGKMGFMSKIDIMDEMGKMGYGSSEAPTDQALPFISRYKKEMEDTISNMRPGGRHLRLQPHRWKVLLALRVIVGHSAMKGSL